MEEISKTEPNTKGIDLDLYSRQIGAFGVEAMGKLIKLRVFVQGLKGVKILKFNILKN